MRLIGKLAIFAFGSAISVVAASATTFDSNAASTSYLGYSATNPTQLGSFTNPTYNIGTGGVWTAPVGVSSWVSFDPNTAPGGSLVAPNGYYLYTASFTAGSDPSSYVQLTVMADDTVSVYLNSFNDQVLSQYNGSSFPKCAAGQPNCIVPLTFDFTGLNPGTNVLGFVVHQAARASTGLDYEGSVLTPEPSSLVLLGTGLLGTAGGLLRRVRRS